MPMNTIIEKIRAEIEQMLHSIENCPFISGELGAREKEIGEVTAYKNILSRLSDLEKELVKDFPTTDEEMKQFLATHPKVEAPDRYKTPDWMFEKSEKPTPAEGLEEEIERYLSTEWELDEDLNKDEPIYIYDCTWEDLKVFARHFAQWQKQHDAELIEIAYNDGITIGMTKQKEQMLEEAVEGEVYLYHSYKRDAVAILVDIPKETLGDKVRVIVLKKED